MPSSVTTLGGWSPSTSSWNESLLPPQFPIAIERPSGLIVDTLLAYGHMIVPIHPNAVKSCRPRYSVTGRKNDLGDAYLLADVLRTDGHRFRPLAPPSDAIKTLRAMVIKRDRPRYF